jgi:hypothetical protein
MMNKIYRLDLYKLHSVPIRIEIISVLQPTLNYFNAKRKTRIYVI